MVRKGFLIFVVAAAIAATPPAGAQITETGESGLITVPTAETLAPGKVSVGVYARRDIESGSGREFEDSVAGIRDTDLTVGSVVVGVGILDGLELSTQIPYVAFQVDQPGENTDPRAIGNVRVTPKFQIFREGESSVPLSLGILGSVALPTGDDRFPAPLDRSSLFQEELSWEVMGVLDKELFTLPGNAPVVLTLNGGGLFPEDNEISTADQQTQPVFEQLRRQVPGFPTAPGQPFPRVTVEDAVVQWGAGLKVPLWKDFLGELDLLGEYRGNTGTIEEIDEDFHMVLAGLRYIVWNGLSVGGGVDFGLTDVSDRYNIVGGLTWTGPQNYRLPVAPPETKVVYKDRVIHVEKLVFGDINFEFDKAALTHQGRGRVYLVAQKLKEGKNVKVEIQGHTDYLGTDEYNKALGLRRAETIKSELTRLGVDPAQISTVSFGEGEPLIDKETPWARAVNRRVQFVVVSESEEPQAGAQP